MNIKRAAVLGIALSTLFCVPAFAKTEGQWVNDGRQFQKPDGTLAYNEWIEGDNGSFFYVGADGNYVTGWRTIRETNGEATHEYYFNPADGAMFYSTYTPDGFWVNGDGVKVEDPAAAATETAEGAQQETAQTEAQTQAAETAAETADSGQQAEAGSLAEGYSATAAAELLALLNQERSNAGQEPLAENEDLRLAAEVRAKEIAEELERSDIATGGAKKTEPEEEPVQLSLFDTMGILPVEVKESPVEQELKALDLGNMTPIQALNLLYELQQKCR